MHTYDELVLKVIEVSGTSVYHAHDVATALIESVTKGLTAEQVNAVLLELNF